MAEYRRGRGPHFAPIPFELLEDPEADAYVIATYAAIKSYADFGSAEGAEVSDRTACKRAGCSERKFRECREKLRELGWLEWDRVTTATGTINRYVVHNSPAPVEKGAEGVRHGVPEGVRQDMPDPSGTACRRGPARGADNQEPGTKSHRPRGSGSSSLRSSEPGHGPNVEMSKTRGGRRKGASSAAGILAEMIGEGESEPHVRRARVIGWAQEHAWLGQDPPLFEGESPESARSSEAKIAGELLAYRDNDILAAIAGAREHLGPGRQFRLRLLMAKPAGHAQPLFHYFHDRYFKRDTGPTPAAVVHAIRAALLGAGGA